jgi:hypothetical protein
MGSVDGKGGRARDGCRDGIEDVGPDDQVEDLGVKGRGELQLPSSIETFDLPRLSRPQAHRHTNSQRTVH